jgi:hypothetical protein
MSPVAAPRVTQPKSLKNALKAIGGKSNLFGPEDWDEVFEGLAKSGLYAWWVDAAGAKELSDGLGVRVKSGLLYANEAGATIWPNGRASRHTLLSQVANDDLDGNITRSTFRLTLAAALKKPLKLKKRGSGKLMESSEDRLTGWMREHLSLALYQHVAKDELNDLLERVLRELDPPLNLRGMQPSDARMQISLLRKTITD